MGHATESKAIVQCPPCDMLHNTYLMYLDVLLCAAQARACFYLMQCDQLCLT